MGVRGRAGWQGVSAPLVFFRIFPLISLWCVIKTAAASVKRALDTGTGGSYPESVLQLSFNNERHQERFAEPDGPRTLLELAEGEDGILEALDLPTDISHRLMELGFIPGLEVTAVRSAPGGDPRVFRVDGSEFALRQETARHILIRGTQLSR